MKNIVIIIASILATSAYARMATFKYERETNMTKQCVYEYAGSEYTITVKSWKNCPSSIEVDVLQ